MSKARECGSKAKHSKKKAKAHRWSLIKSRGAAPSSIDVYKCPHCGFWHVGHTKRNRK